MMYVVLLTESPQISIRTKNKSKNFILEIISSRRYISEIDKTYYKENIPEVVRLYSLSYILTCYSERSIREITLKEY